MCILAARPLNFLRLDRDVHNVNDSQRDAAVLEPGAVRHGSMPLSGIVAAIAIAAHAVPADEIHW